MQQLGKDRPTDLAPADSGRKTDRSHPQDLGEAGTAVEAGWEEMEDEEELVIFFEFEPGTCH